MATPPAPRGKGIGSAVTAHALDEARTSGRQTALLIASEMGEPVYRRLGFQTHGTVGQYIAHSTSASE